MLFVLTSLPVSRGHLLPRDGVVNASGESISTFQSTDCSTPKFSWNLGQTACAVATGAPDGRRIVWIAPNGAIAQFSAQFSGTLQDSYAIPAGADPFAQVGLWTVATIDGSGVGFAAATFVVHDPTTANADLSISKFGPFQASAGSSIAYRIEVTNNGPDDAQNVVVVDAVPGNTTFVSESQSSGPPFTCTTPSVGSGSGSITCTAATLGANQTAVFVVVFNINAGTPDSSTITNSATVSSDTNDGHQADNAGSSTTAVAGTTTSGSCTVSCQADITVNNDQDQCSAVVTYTTPASSGDCTDPETGVPIPVNCSPPSGSAFPIGTTAVTCSAGSAFCGFNVNVNDTRPPVDPTISCPSNITVDEEFTGAGQAPVSYAAPTTTGNCVTATCDPPSGSSFRLGTTTVTCTATDSAHNSVSCGFTVTVNSTLACLLTCSGDVTQAADPDHCSAVVNYPSPSAGGICGTVTCTPASGSTFPVGATAVTCSSSQGPSCSFTVNVIDTTPPTITCPADIVVYLPLNSTATSSAVSYAVTATDNCSGVAVTSTPASGSVFPLGTSTVNATAVDASNNSSSCSFTVTVLYDFTGFFAPVANPPALNTVNAGRAIPVKFSLSGDKGLNIFAPGYPVSGTIACDASAPPNEVTGTITAGGSSLSYDAAADQYIYVWKTDSSWAGTCRQLIVTLNDGSTHVANFKFR